ncbi:MAG TPA: beta-ketoacyl-ACP synthase II [Rhabdochlamydiaceae bacterium]|jgi:3-oxoacyl-[acyl-carrier-protein] synthase II|nr:beta-ketoacyl-ACP synthase II [Rhabdochlamydiaceae bacterium]
MAKRRIVVTGMGIVSCFGNDVDHFYDQLLAGKSGIGLIESFPCADYPTRFAGCVKNFDVGNYLDKKQARRVDPFIRYTMVAGKKALEKGNLIGDSFAKLNKSRCGIIIGSGMGGMQVFSDGVETIVKEGFKRISPFFVPYIITNMGGALLAIDLGFTGPNYSISTACATSNNSIVSAAQHIERGDADLMLCGGSEACIVPIGVGGFIAMKALSERNDEPQKASRPWDKKRDGFVMGEGSGVILLESLEHALARGAPIYGEYLGGAINCDAYHITSPREDGSGVADCMNLALKDAGIPKEQINYINCHATSTQAGDLCELIGIKSVFGDHIKHVSINATKSMTGHCLGAAGGIEAIATLKAIETGMLHPTINIEEPEEMLDGIDYVSNVAKAKTVTAALSNSFGFGGHNSTLIFAPYRES